MKYRDPYDEMGDEEFEQHVIELFDKPESVSVSIRIPKPLLTRIKAVAGGVKQPYQTLMKGILEDAIQRLERRPKPTARRKPVATRTASRRAVRSVAARRRTARKKQPVV
jgi:predicted DNA binding CopG/RHH family protein